jgi:hypothetical protein
MEDAWWRMTGSNRRPPACKAGALPAELIPPSLDFDKRRIAALFASLHSFRYAADALALHCLLLKAHRLWCGLTHHPVAATPLVCENQAGQGGASRRIRICMQARRQRRHAPVIADQWWVWVGSNHRPPPYQDGALTS